MNIASSEQAIDLDQRPASEVEDEVARLAAQLAATTGSFLRLLAELDRREAWGGQGFLSLAHWLAWRVGLDLATAREHVRVARALVRLPRTAAALDAALVSYSKVRAMTRIARPETEEALLETARETTAGQLERIIKGIRAVQEDAIEDRAVRIEARRGIEIHFAEDGMLVVRGRLAPEEGALLVRALDEARRALWTGDRSADVTATQERADAFMRILDRDRAGSERVQVLLHVDETILRGEGDGRSYLEDGPGAPAEMSRRLACDAVSVEVTHGESITVGRKTRRISAALRRALAVRDEARCRFPGCTHRIVDAHHVVHWSDGGPTELGNLLLLCRRHHVLVHEGGFSAELTRDRAVFRRRDGRPIPLVPPLPVPGPKNVAGDPWSLAATWDGGPIDHGWVVDALTV